MAASRLNALATGLAAAAIAAILAAAGMLDPLDEAIHDRLAARLAPVPPDPGIVLVAIDEPSFADIGTPWPWPRSLHGRLAEALRAAGARTVVFDILFADPGPPAEDAALAAALGPDIVLAADREVMETPQGRLTLDVLPQPAFLATGARAGRIAVPLDADGTMRRFPDEPDALARVLLPGAADPPPGARIPFAGPPGHFPRVSYYQALDPPGLLPPGTFRDKLVIVGFALRAAADLRAGGQDHFRTPWAATGAGLMAGMEVQANLIAARAAGLAVVPLPSAVAPVIGLLLGPLLALGLRGRGPRRATALLLASLAAVATLTAGLLATGVWLPPAAPLLAALLAEAAQTAADFGRERLERRRVARAFGHYLAPEVVARLARDPAALRLGGERRRITALFCDLRDFTTLSEVLKDDPEGLTRLVNRALTPISDAILRHGGTIDKIVGDCVVGFWNAPLDQPDHAARAVRAGMEATEAIARLSAVVRAEAEAQGRPLPTLAAGAGVNTGECVVGNIGTATRFTYTAMGDAMNLASRLEGLTKVYGVPLLIGEDCAGEAGLPPLVELDRVAVKGRRAPTAIFAALDLPPEAAALQRRALEAYRGRDWAEAARLWAELAREAPQTARYAAVMAGRTTRFAGAPPAAGWQGTWQADEK